MRLYRSGSTQRRKPSRFGRIIKWMVICVVLTGLYGAVISPRRVEVAHHDVVLANLPSELDGLRVAQITDLHIGPLFREGSVRRIVRSTNELDPDIVVLTGDFTNFRSTRYILSATKELGALRSRHGVYACLGNHDYWEDAGAVRRALRAAHVRVLSNENIEPVEGLSLAAIDDMMSGHPDFARTIKGLPADNAVVFLSHNPIILTKISEHPWLALAGHTHGGQIALPLLGPRETVALPCVRTFFKYNETLGVRARNGNPDSVSIYRFPAGWYSSGRARMYVSRGLGANLGVPIRLNCPPELACFTLRVGYNKQ